VVGWLVGWLAGCRAGVVSWFGGRDVWSSWLIGWCCDGFDSCGWLVQVPDGQTDNLPMQPIPPSRLITASPFEGYDSTHAMPDHNKQ